MTFVTLARSARFPSLIENARYLKFTAPAVTARPTILRTAPHYP